MKVRLVLNIFLYHFFRYRRVSLAEFSEKLFQNWAPNIVYNLFGHIRETVHIIQKMVLIYPENRCQWVSLNQLGQMQFPSYIKNAPHTKKKVRLWVAILHLILKQNQKKKRSSNQSFSLCHFWICHTFSFEPTISLIHFTNFSVTTVKRNVITSIFNHSLIVIFGLISFFVFWILFRSVQ